MTLTERLREKISQAFYNHGLLCASYPIPIILFTGLCILACCYPLLKLPLPGTGPVEFTTPVKDYSPPPAAADHRAGEPSEQPEWYVGAPVAYIQQIFVKSSVSPWHKNLLAVDVFRSPLSRAFQLVEEIRNHMLRDRSQTSYQASGSSGTSSLSMAACYCPLGTSGRMIGNASMLTRTSSGPSTNMSPKPCRLRQHSKSCCLAFLESTAG